MRAMPFSSSLGTVNGKDRRPLASWRALRLLSSHRAISNNDIAACISHHYRFVLRSWLGTLQVGRTNESSWSPSTGTAFTALWPLQDGSATSCTPARYTWTSAGMRPTHMAAVVAYSVQWPLSGSVFDVGAWLCYGRNAAPGLRPHAA